MANGTGAAPKTVVKPKGQKAAQKFNFFKCFFLLFCYKCCQSITLSQKATSFKWFMFLY